MKYPGNPVFEVKIPEKKLDLSVRCVTNTSPKWTKCVHGLKNIDTLAVLRKLQPSILGLCLKNEELTNEYSMWPFRKKAGNDTGI